MSIGEFSARCGLSPKQLRSYAVTGLLVPCAVDADSGYRYYAPAQLPTAELIDALRRAGMPLAEITSVLGDKDVTRLDLWANHLRADASRKRQALDQACELLVAMEKTRNGKDAGTMRLQAAGRTETGPVRENNEDTIAFRENLLAVADGMGGHSAGEVASTLATQAVAALFTGRSADELESAVRAANWAVWERASTHPELEGMGTTFCTLGVIADGVVAIANVGDSRAYLARNGSLQALTDDHTVAGQLLREGKLTAREAARHPQRHLLTRALGVGAETVIDTTCLDAVIGDRLLLCTDGVFSSTSDEELAQLVAESENPQAAADAVVDRALANGSDDNASAVVAFITG